MNSEIDWPYAADASKSDRLGIAFSGGGIRSASFCLGAYQYLSRQGIFGRASFVSAVSGGSYIAGAIAVALANSDETVPSSSDVWAHGSPEERHLRNHLSYLAPGLRGRSWLAANFAYGLLLSIAPLYLVLFVVGRTYGIALWYLYPGIGSPNFEPARMVYTIGSAAALVFISIFLVAANRVKSHEVAQQDAPRRSTYERAAEVALISGTAVIIVGAVVPYLVHSLAWLLSVSPDVVMDRPADWMPRRLLLSAEAVGLFLLVGGIAILLLRVGRLRGLRTILAWLSGLGLLATPFLLAAEAAVTRPPEVRRDVGLITVAALIEFVFAVCVPSRLYSMHLYYRDRLSRAFILGRHIDHERAVAEPMPYNSPVHFSEVGRMLSYKRSQGVQVPSFVVCAAVAAREGDVPHKSWATSFTFGDDVSVSPELRFKMLTTELERSERDGGAQLTLPSMMAISGAALSPLMGRFSLPAFRLLMAVLNLRLGVWIPNPNTHHHQAGQYGTFHRIGRRILSRLCEPGALYAVREGLGLVRATSRYIHVSDGGTGKISDWWS